MLTAHSFEQKGSLQRVKEQQMEEGAVLSGGGQVVQRGPGMLQAGKGSGLEVNSGHGDAHSCLPPAPQGRPGRARPAPALSPALGSHQLCLHRSAAPTHCSSATGRVPGIDRLVPAPGP